MSKPFTTEKSVCTPWVAFALPFCGYFIWLAESFFAPPNPLWALCLFVWTLIAGLLAWKLTRLGESSTLTWLDSHASAVVLVAIGIFVFFSVATNILQSQYFALGARAQDTAYNSQILWNTLHGHFLRGNLNQESLYSPPVSNELALHVSPVLLIAILPIYAIAPHFLTLLIIRDIALAVAAWPLFLISRDRLGSGTAVAVAALYLISPAVVAQVFQEFTLLQLAPLPFLFACRAFLLPDFPSFLVWMAIAMSVREDVAVSAAGFGLVAMLVRRPVRWWCCGICLPILWWLLTTTVIEPFFGRHGNSALDVALAGGSQGPLATSFGLLLNPAWLLRLITIDSAVYLYHILRPMAFLPVFAIEGFFALPGLAANLFLLNTYSLSGTGDPTSRFALLPTCALMVASVSLIGRVGRRYCWDLRTMGIILFLLLPSATLLQGVKDAVQLRLVMYNFMVPNDAAALWQAMGMIPDDSSVAAPDYALPALSQRHRLYDITNLHRYPNAQPEFFLFDRNLDRVTANPTQRKRYLELLEDLSRSGLYDVIWKHGDYFVLHASTAKKEEGSLFRDIMREANQTQDEGATANHPFLSRASGWARSTGVQARPRS